MSLSRITRLPPAGRLFLKPTATPPSSLPGPRLSNSYRRPGEPEEDWRIWKKVNFDFAKGVGGVKKHFALLKKELLDPLLVGPQGKTLEEHVVEQNRVLWEFRGPESLEQWNVSSDQEIGGHSEVQLTTGRNNTTCMLRGNLSSVPPRDGETRYSGYCTMRSKQLLVSGGASSPLFPPL